MPLAKNRQQITVTTIAHEYISEIVANLRSQGKAVSITSMVSDAILAIPMPAVQAEPIIEEGE